MIGVSNSLDLDQARRFVGDLLAYSILRPGPSRGLFYPLFCVTIHRHDYACQ